MMGVKDVNEEKCRSLARAFVQDFQRLVDDCVGGPFAKVQLARSIGWWVGILIKTPLQSAAGGKRLSTNRCSGEVSRLPQYRRQSWVVVVERKWGIVMQAEHRRQLTCEHCGMRRQGQRDVGDSLRRLDSGSCQSIDMRRLQIAASRAIAVGTPGIDADQE